MKNLKVVYKEESCELFTKGKEYNAQLDGDGYNEPFTVCVKDDDENIHIVAEHSLEEEWFKQHFNIVKEE